MSSNSSPTPAPTPDQAPVATLDYEHSSLEQFIVTHSKKLLLVGGLALAGTLLYLGSRMLSDYKESKSRIAFYQATTLGDLQKVADEHEGQPAAGTAMVDAARKLAEEQRTGEAIEILTKFIAKYKEAGHPLLDFGRFQLGDMLAAAGRPDEAKPYYDSIVQGNGAFAPRAEIRLADALVKSGKKDDAKGRYEKLQNLPNADAQLKAEAKERLELLKRTPPTVIPYVEPPKPEAAAGEPKPEDLKIGAPSAGGDAFGNIGLGDPSTPEMKDEPKVEATPENPVKPANPETPATPAEGTPAAGDNAKAPAEGAAAKEDGTPPADAPATPADKPKQP